MREVEKMYRLAVFNVLAHNRDDTQEFQLPDGCARQWSLSPAYDLTFSTVPGESKALGDG